MHQLRAVTYVQILHTVHSARVTWVSGSRRPPCSSSSVMRKRPPRLWPLVRKDPRVGGAQAVERVQAGDSLVVHL